MEGENLGKLAGPRLLEGALGLVVLAVLLNAMAKTKADPDLWGYLAFGRLFWETGAFPYRDVFSYVPTLPLWVYHEWLTGVLFYPLYQALGGAGLQFLKYAVGLATVAMVYLTARQRGASLVSAALVLFLIQLFPVIGFSPVRAQIFTYCFFATSVYLLENARLNQRWRGLWLLVPLQALWCNLHGGFLSGLGLIGLYALGEALSRRPFRPYLRVLLLSGLVTLANPYGWEYWHYLWIAVSMPRPEITEWASLWAAYQQSHIGPFELAYTLFIISFAGFLAVRTRWRELSPTLSLVLVLYLGLNHLRHLTFFLLLVGAYLPARLSKYLETRPQARVSGSSRLRPILALILALTALSPAYQFLSKQPLHLDTPPLPEAGDVPGQYYPVGAVAYLRSHRVSGKLLTEFGWGEYLIWTLYPQCRVALDGRYETVYPPGVAALYFNFINQIGNSRQFLEDYPPDLILLAPRSKACGFIASHPGWRRVYADAGSALFVRRPGLPSTPAASAIPLRRAISYNDPNDPAIFP